VALGNPFICLLEAFGALAVLKSFKPIEFEHEDTRA
jgi:hypothetical protein